MNGRQLFDFLSELLGVVLPLAVADATVETVLPPSIWKQFASMLLYCDEQNIVWIRGYIDGIVSPA